MFKYWTKYDSYKINEKDKFIYLNNEKIYFDTIDYCFVVELPEQPTRLERLLSKVAFRIELRELIILMKDGTRRIIRFNYRDSLYKALKKLEPFVRMDFNVEVYKSSKLRRWLFY